MELGLKGRTVLVTASSKGIGKAIAEAFLSEGSRVAICARDKQALIETSAELRQKYGYEPVWCVCDLNNPDDIDNCIKILKKEIGSVEILINNCGGPATGFFRELKDTDWQKGFEQVLLSNVRMCNKILPDMLLQEWGRIINITSISVKQPIENLMLSNALRSGLTGFAKTLSNEVAKFNITVNNVAPGYTLTNRLYDLAISKAKLQGISHEEVLADMAKEIPMKRLARPEEIAAAVLFLASEQASYITGTTIQVDGGWIKSTT